MVHAALLRKALSAVPPAVGWEAKVLILWVWGEPVWGGWLSLGQAVSLGCPALRRCCPAPARAALLEGSRGRLWPHCWPLTGHRHLPPTHVHCHVPVDQEPL